MCLFKLNYLGDDSGIDARFPDPPSVRSLSLQSPTQLSLMTLQRESIMHPAIVLWQKWVLYDLHPLTHQRCPLPPLSGSLVPSLFWFSAGKSLYYLSASRDGRSQGPIIQQLAR